MAAFWQDRPLPPGNKVRSMAPTPQIDAMFAKLKAHCKNEPGVDLGKMLHAQALRVHGKAFCFATDTALVMKLPRERVDWLDAEGTGTGMTMGTGRVMKEWIALSAEDETLLRALADEARAFVASLTRKA